MPKDAHPAAAILLQKLINDFVLHPSFADCSELDQALGLFIDMLLETDSWHQVSSGSEYSCGAEAEAEAASSAGGKALRRNDGARTAVHQDRLLKCHQYATQRLYPGGSAKHYMSGHIRLASRLSQQYPRGVSGG